MTRHAPADDARVLAEAVRQACLDAAREALQTAAFSGLCREGAEEAALDAIRALDLEKTLHLPARGKKA